MGYHEIKEFQKGHVALHASLEKSSMQTIGKRHASRLLSDAYCKGLVRGQVECCNLRAYHRDGPIVDAERITTAKCEVFPGGAYVQALDELLGQADGKPRKKRYVKTAATPVGQNCHLREARTAQAYGHRPVSAECWWLSPYEFTMYWEVVPTRVPETYDEWEKEASNVWDVDVTPAGVEKLQTTAGKGLARLRPGTHYKIAIEPSQDVHLFDATPATAALRHNWYLRRRSRPRCPHFGAAPAPVGFADNAEKNAKLTSVYFRAWTLDATRATFTVPYLGRLRGADETWEESLRAWLLRVPSAETKRYVGNFLSVYRVRPAADGDNNSDDEDADDYIDLQPAQVLEALKTQTPAHKKNASKWSNDARSGSVDAAMAQADRLWKVDPLAGTTAAANNAYAEVDGAQVRRNARKKQAPAVPTSEAEVAGSVRCDFGVGRQHAVQEWVEALRREKTCNREQIQFCVKVVDRVTEEATLVEQMDMEPLRWVLHGGPGTGKSFVLRLLREELFERVLGWQHGVQFQIVSFQAVMAELLEGDTIHHALGLDWGGENSGGKVRMLERMQQTLQWRWLILDEFSMVSAELLAQLELRCRELMRDLSVAKYGQGEWAARPFGGLNVILSGDLYQLPPPKGTFLGDVPWDLVAGRRASKRATGHQGQALLWGGGKIGMQGVSELVTCERTTDVWLRDLQEQFRYGRLSSENHAFLHGHPTAVPGSWIAGALLCGERGCQKLIEEKACPRRIMEQECAQCKEERRTRKLVADPSDGRFGDKFKTAIAIFATNDIKYHVNKARAVEWAKAHEQRIHIAVARDKASANVLVEKPDLQGEKVKWLTRHDKECGGLYGMLPLAIGMPVRATEHLDRARGILKGCKGTIVGWSGEKSGTAGEIVLWNALPEVLYVKFETKTEWCISGLEENNVYPVSACKRVWYLDKDRKYPQLRVTRTQFPLAPSFAVTAHVAQGQTLPEGVIADLCVMLGSACFTAYIAVTRVRSRDDLLIFRPFKMETFQTGVNIGRELLLRQLRGEFIDWKALLAKYCEERACANCHERKQAQAFTAGQWKRCDIDRVCRACVQHFADIGTPWQCNVCKQWHVEDNFPVKHRQRQCSFYRVCCTCEVCKVCVRCQVSKGESEFSLSAWKARHADRRVCRACTSKVRGYWQCQRCGEQKPTTEYTSWRANKKYTQNGSQTCNACNIDVLVRNVARLAVPRLEPLRQRVAREKQATVLSKVWEAIAAHMAARTAAPAEDNVPAVQTASRPTDGGTECEKEHKQYTCPYCQAAVRSTVRTGTICTRGHCGKQFRVRDGVVCREYKHKCPTCSAEVLSSVASGQIQVLHKNSKGKTCRTSKWTTR